MRYVPLLGLVLLMVLPFALSVQAQPSGTPTVEDVTAFPFLSARVDQANMLANAFVFQMKLFAGTGSAEGGVPAIRLLAMFAALVGGVMIAFFPKYQKPPVMFAWVLVLVITLFAPLGSKLLFYPIKSIPEAPMLAYNGKDPPVQNGQPCTENPDGCGFTPQLAAVHLGSVMQVIASELFKGGGWTGLLERQTAATELYTRPDFNLGGPWLNLKKEYAEAQCRGSLESVLNNTAEENSAANAPTPTLNKVWDVIGKRFANANGNFAVAPPYIVFPTSKKQAEALQWSPDAMSKYQGGVKEMCNIFCSSSNRGKGVVLDDVADAATTITVQAAFDDMKKTYPSLFSPELSRGQSSVASGVGAFFDGVMGTYGRSGPLNGPGVYFAVSEPGDTPKLKDGGEEFASRKCYVQDKIFSAWDDPGALVGTRILTNSANGKCTADNGKTDLYLNQRYSPTFHAATFKVMNDEYVNNPSADRMSLTMPWMGLAMLMNDVNSPFMKMPVGVGNVISLPGNDSKIFPDKKIEVIPAFDCKSIGKQIVDTVVNALSDKSPNGKQKKPYFDKLIATLEGTGAVPVPLKLEDITSMTSAELKKNPDGAMVVNMMMVRLNEATRRVNQNNLESGERDKKMRAAMVNSLIELMQRVTMQTNGSYEQAAPLAQAAVDGVSMNPEMIGFNMVGAGGVAEGAGAAAFGFGRIIAKIGAFITGPLAIAFIQFLTVFVDMTLMVIITITPILLMFGLVVPSSAAGVLTIAVLSVFILKFVPVTLIILNGVSGMIYDLLPASVGIHADFMRDLLIIAMGGMYMNIVGLTFFLMFKIGDPAAFLGRLTALDGAAKQLADRGMGAVVAASTAAALMAGGAAGAVLGRGTLGAAARRAGKELGIPNSVMDAMSAGSKGAAVDQKKGGPKTREEMLKEKYNAEQLARINDPSAARARISAMDRYGLTEEQADDLIANGSLMTDEHGLLSLDETGKDGWTIMGGDLAGTGDSGRDSRQSRYAKGTGSTVDAIEGGSGGRDGGTSEVPGGDAPDMPPSGGGEGGAAADNVTASGATINGDTSADGGVNTAGGAGGGGGGIPAQVTVVGGTLGSIGEVGRVANTSAAVDNRDVQAQIADNEKKRAADMGDQLNAAADAILMNPDASPAAKAAAQRSKDAVANAANVTDMATIKDQFDRDLKASGTSLAAIEKDGVYRRNMNDQIADELATVERELQSKGISEKRKEDLTAYKKKLLAIDPVALTQGELLSEMGTLENLKKSIDVRGAADKLPGYWASAMSGVYGAFAGAGGGLGKIPIIGPAIGEVANEFYQAPERARAWQAAGGYSKWKQAQGDAQRMGFYQKEMGPLAAAHQYNSMQAIGGFQAQADIARQAASEAVAKSRTQFEGLLAHTKNLDKNYMTVGELAGLGRMDAAQRVASVRQEAYLMQGEQVMVKKGNVSGGLLRTTADGRLDVNIKDTNVVLTADALNRVSGELMNKKFSGSFDDMMITHYGIAEKQYLRGDAGWDATRGMHRDGVAARQFARKDVDTDYAVGGHIKMVEGKIKFKDSQAQYETLVSMRNQENGMKRTQITEILQSQDPEVRVKAQRALVDAVSKIDPADMKAIGHAQRKALEGVAKDVLTSQKILMPLEAVFSESASNGAKKYWEKAYLAPFNEAALDSKMYGNIQKASSAVFDTINNINQKALKPINLTVGNFVEQMDKAPNAIFDKIVGAVGGDLAQMNRFMSAVTDTLKAKPSGLIVTTGGKKDEWAKGQQALSDDAFRDMLSRISQIDPNVADKLKGSLTRDGDKWIISQVHMKANGEIERK